MLYVKARVGISDIHGLGLFATDFIPKDTVIWRFQVGFDIDISEQEFSRLSAPAQAQVRHYAYFSNVTRRYHLSSDDDRFTNHSNTPNIRFIEGCSRAMRDIQAGEELTNDYRDFDAEPPL
jgi:uncharacterized protein